MVTKFLPMIGAIGMMLGFWSCSSSTEDNGQRTPSGKIISDGGGTLPEAGTFQGEDAMPGGDAIPGENTSPDSGTIVSDKPLPDLVEDRNVYKQDNLEVIKVYITVTDLDKLKQVDDNVPDAEVQGIFKTDSFASNLTLPNGVLSLRGKSTRQALQKSYKFKLESKTDLWRGHRVINLNKHPYDLTRARNKLSFDYFREIPHMASLRTQFVQLFINGEDKGLFTQIEQPNQYSLLAHGLDQQGHLYKAELFWFQPISKEVAANQAEFEKIIEIKAEGDGTHTKLLNMLSDVNNEALDIDDLIAKYFNRNNYLTWFATSLLFSNLDTMAQNFMLYSPSGYRGFYFIGWDYDGGWGWYEQPGAGYVKPRWMDGISNWWSVILHQRFLMKEKNRKDLEAKIEELLAKYITQKRTKELLDSYYAVIKSFISTKPDSWNLPLPSEIQAKGEAEQIKAWGEAYNRIVGDPDRAFQEYKQTIERPMPVYLGTPSIAATEIHFNWSSSFDMQGDEITYDFQLSLKPTFDSAEIVLEKLGLKTTEVTVPTPAKGQYFWRVIIRDTKNPAENWQIAFDSYWDQVADITYSGLMELIVP